MVDKAALLALWYQALEAKVGLRVRTSNFKSLSAQMYEVRVEQNDPKLGTLFLKKDGDDLLIVRKVVQIEVEDPNGPEAET